MGVDVKQNRSNRWVGAIAAIAILATVGIVGCSGTAQPAATSADVQQAVESPAEEVVAAQPMATELTGAVLEPGEGSTELVLSATGPLSWTSYRQDGALIVELANAVPGEGVGRLEGAGPVRGVSFEVDRESQPPVTRVVIATAQSVESDVVPRGEELIVSLAQSGEVETEAVATAPAPLVEETVESADLDQPAPVGTPDQPFVAPDPDGVLASQLQGVDVESDSQGTVVEVRGDGAFRYSTFRLEDPERFVVDLTGVAESSPVSAVAVGDGLVERVRMAQFRSEPERVARIVVDLESPVVPTIDRTADGLTLFFPRPGAAARRPAVAEPAPSAVPSEELAEIAAPTTAPEPASPATTEPAPTASETSVAAAPPPPSPQQPAATPASVAAPKLPATGATSDVELFEAANVEEMDLETADEGSGTVTATAPETFSPQTVATGQRQYFGEPISLSLVDADIKDTLRSFAEISGLNIVVYPEVRGSVTVEMTNVPWDQALEQILKMNDLSYEIEGNIMRIAPIQQFRQEAEEEQRLAQAQALSIPLRTVIKRVSYANANQIASLLRSGGGGLLSQRGSVIVDARTNTLIIRELPRYMDTALAVIENLDQPEPQVRIEARVVETNTNFTRTLGIAWGFNGIASAATGNTTGLQFPNNVDATGGVQLLEGAQNGLLDISLGNVINTFTLDATLQAAETEGLVNILSAPSVTVLNNERAEIQSGLQIPIQTIANNTVSVQFVNATLRLQVTPHVTAEGTVLMDINIQKREPQLAFAVVGATNAPIATKEARTRVIVRDGGTTVIGGIYEVSSDQGEDRVPGLANVPIIGHLFKNRTRTDQNEELLIFITPRVIKL